MMDADALAHLLREAPALNSVNLSLDANKRDEFYAAIKRMPTVSGTILQRISLANFREALAVLVTQMANIYTGLAAVIAFGVVYNSTRIALSERARELASLRVLGFTRGEAMRNLLFELALLAVIAQPPGWAIGYALAWALETKMAADVMRAPLIVDQRTYAISTAIALGSAALSALVVWQRIKRLDLVAVLKTRD
jgi:putative ABC transport system permease protein